MGSVWVYQTLPRCPTPQDTQEQLSSRWPAHPQACKYLCSSRRTCTAPLVVADRARACARLPVLAGPLGLALGFYRARVRRLDVAHFNCKDELRATKHGGSALRPYSPCFARVLSNVVGRLQACGTLCDIVSLRLHSFAGLKSRSRMSGRGSTRGKEENEKIFGATACSLSALGKIIFCSPSSRADASK
jgi:hypothetical protein